MARATADRALADGLLKPELAEALLDVLADGDREGGAPDDAALVHTARRAATPPAPARSRPRSPS